MAVTTIALEWDRHEARIAAVDQKASRPELTHLFTIPLSEDWDLSTKAETIAEAITSKGLSKANLVASVSRSHTELKMVSLPPVIDEELPDIVRLQAMKDFQSFRDDTLLDYAPLDDFEEGQERHAMVAALHDDAKSLFDRIAKLAQLKPVGLHLRPFPCAFYAEQNCSDLAGNHLLIDLLREEVDLSVICEKRMVFLRTTRNRGEDLLENPSELKSLSSEIRRTIAAARNQLHGQSVDRVVVIGNSEAHKAIAENLDLEAGMKAICFDPTSGVKISRELKSSLPERIERFSSLFGLLGSESNAFETINFLAPKEKPKPKSQKQRILFYASAAALVVIGLSLMTWKILSDMKAQVADLQSQIDEAKPLMDALKSSETKFDSIDRWVKQDAIWLDELLYLSENYSNSESGMVLYLKMNSGRGAKPTITLDGITDSDKISLGELETGLRDYRHSINNAGQSEDDTTKRYDTRFNATISIDVLAEEPEEEPSQAEGSDDETNAANNSTSTPVKK